jgi:hypothetical protein
MAYKWTDDTVIEFIKDRFSISETADLRDAMTAFKSEKLQTHNKILKRKTVRLPADGIRRYTDSKDRVWILTKESLPKKRGEYIYWLGETLDKTLITKSDTKKGLIESIEVNHCMK